MLECCDAIQGTSNPRKEETTMALFTYFEEAREEGRVVRVERINWKNLLLVVLAIVVVVGLVLGFVVFSRQGGTTGTPSQPGVTQPGTGFTVNGPYGTINIKLASDWPSQLRPEFNKAMDAGQTGGVIWGLGGKISNTSSQTVQFDALTLSCPETRYNDVWVYMGGMLIKLAPGQSISFYHQFLTDMTKVKNLVVGVRNFQVVGSVPTATPTQPPAVTPTPVTPTPTATPTTEWPIKGQWTVLVSGGTLTFIYRETDSARDKIKVWVDEKSKTMTFENLLDQPILTTGHQRLTYVDGRVVSMNQDWADAQEVKARNKWAVSLAEGPAATWELWYEVKLK